MLEEVDIQPRQTTQSVVSNHHVEPKHVRLNADVHVADSILCVHEHVQHVYMQIPICNTRLVVIS